MTPRTVFMNARVFASDFKNVDCPNRCGAAMQCEWVAVGNLGTIVVGHALACERCRPEGVWSCRFCPDLVKLDGRAIRDHLADCLGAR